MEQDQQLIDFLKREENQSFLKGLRSQLPQNSKNGNMLGNASHLENTGEQRLMLKAENVLKLEYAVLKERQKNLIIKDYLDTEINAL